MTSCNLITERFLECFEQLLATNGVRSARQFAINLGYLPQSFSEIQKGRRDVPVEILRKAVELYRFNPVYLLLGQGDYFYKEDHFHKTKILPIVTDPSGTERIVHVPVKAQAGYATDSLESTTWFEHLPAYNLPDYMYNVGTFRSFEVSGDSMHPTLEEGDVIVCSYVDNHYWDSSIKDHFVYVIVTQGDVLVKRVINNLRRHRHLELHSDNDFYPVLRVNLMDIKEVWLVRSKICKFNHSFSPSTAYSSSSRTEETEALKEIIAEQKELITTLKSMINQVSVEA